MSNYSHQIFIDIPSITIYFLFEEMTGNVSMLLYYSIAVGSLSGYQKARKGELFSYLIRV